MLGHIFHSENGFFRGVSKLMDIVGLSVVWLVFCLPVVTIGPATAALYYSAVKCLRRGEVRPYQNYWQSFRGNLRVGVVVTLPCVAVGLLLGWEYWALGRVVAAGDRTATGAYAAFTILLLLPLGFLCWLFPLLSRFQAGPGSLLWSAFQFTLRHLPTTVAVALLNILLAAVTVRLWFFLPIAVTPALGAVLSSFLLERVLKKYMPEEPSGEDQPWYLK